MTERPTHTLLACPIDHGIQEREHPHVLEGRAAGHRYEAACERLATDGGGQLGGRDLLLTQAGVSHLLVKLRQRLYQPRQGASGHREVFWWQRQRLHVAVGIREEHPLVDHVDLTDEAVFGTKRQHDGRAFSRSLRRNSPATRLRFTARSPIDVPAINQFVKPDWKLTRVGIVPGRRDNFWVSTLDLQALDYFPRRGDVVFWRERVRV